MLRGWFSVVRLRERPRMWYDTSCWSCLHSHVSGSQRHHTYISNTYRSLLTVNPIILFIHTAVTIPCGDDVDIIGSAIAACPRRTAAAAAVAAAIAAARDLARRASINDARGTSAAFAGKRSARSLLLAVRRLLCSLTAALQPYQGAMTQK